MSLGSLVVRLGLDAADFVRGIDRAEKDAQRLSRQIGKYFDTAAQGAAIAATAATTAAAATALAFDRMIKGAAEFQDISERMGDSAENIASLAVAAGTAGIGFQEIEAASGRLTKGLAGIDEESKSALRALDALGIKADDFKKLAPVDQLEAVAQSMATFEDGAGKTAAAIALWGKAGAGLLPLIKELGQENARQVILTNEQIRQADEYADKQAKAATVLRVYAQAAATQAVPALTALTETTIDVIKGISGLDAQAAGLKSNDAIRGWAVDSVRGLGFVVDVGDGVVRTFQLIGTSIAAMAAQAAALGRLDFGAIARMDQEWMARRDEITGRAWFSDALAKRLEAMRGASTLPTPPKLPQLDFSNLPGGKGGKSGIGKIRDEFADILKLVDELRGVDFAESIGLDTRTVQDLAKLMQSGLDAAEKARHMDRVMGADPNIRREQDAKDRAIRTAQEFAQSLEDERGAIGLNEEALARYNAQLEKRRALQGVTDPTTIGNVSAMFDTAANAAADLVRRQQAEEAARRGVESMQRLVDGYKAQAGAIGLSGAALARHNVELEREAALRGVLDPLVAKRILDMEAEAKALIDLTDQRARWAADAEHINSAFSSSFADSVSSIIDGSKKASDAFSDMAKSWTKTLNDMAARNIGEALFGGNGKRGLLDFGSFFSNLFNGKGFSLPTFANGTSFAPGGLALVGERGPELVNLPRGAQVIPNHEVKNFRSGNTTNVNVTVNVPPTTDRRSASQIATEVGLRIQRAMWRNT